MKIGEKDYTLKVTNRVIINIEKALNMPISKIMEEVVNFSAENMCLFIHTSIKDNTDISLDDFIDTAEPKQLIPAVMELMGEINSAFGVDLKKK